MSVLNSINSAIFELIKTFIVSSFIKLKITIFQFIVRIIFFFNVNLRFFVVIVVVQDN